MLLRRGLREILRRKFPVHEVPECFQELRTGVAVVDIVGMFPHVAGQQRLVGGSQRRGSVGRVDDVDRTVSFLHQPGPAGTEVGRGGLGEFFLELVQRTPLGVDRVGQCATRSAAAVRLQAIPEKGVVPDLGGVVEQAAGRLLDDVFEGSIFEFRALDQVVQVGHVSLVMLAVMVFQGFLGHVRLQCIHGIGQGRESVFHRQSFLLLSVDIVFERLQL